jgi:hypothetical protein
MFPALADNISQHNSQHSGCKSAMSTEKRGVAHLIDTPLLLTFLVTVSAAVCLTSLFWQHSSAWLGACYPAQHTERLVYTVFFYGGSWSRP